MKNQQSLSRRSLLAGAATAAAGAGLAAAGSVAAAARPAPPTQAGGRAGHYLPVADGTVIHYKDWGSGQPVVFSHGWPLQADAWEDQMFYLASHGYRVIAHDRRGHGLSSQPWNGNDMDTYADDLATLLNTLDIKNAMLVGHSTGGGEVARYIGRHGTRRVAKAVLVGAVPPQMVKSPTNPNGLPMSVFDGIRAGVQANRGQLFLDLAMPFYGYNRAGAKPTQGVIDAFYAQGMQCGLKNAYDCVKQFSETDFTADLKKIDVPTLIVHGSDDQIVPIDAAGKASAKIVKNAKLLVYEGAPHGLPITVFDGIRAGVLADRSQFYKDLSTPFYGFNRAGAKPSQGVIDAFYAQGMQCGLKNAYDCVKQFSETDFTADLKKIDVPTLIVHGSDDQIVPIAASGKASAKIVKNAKLVVYEGAPHGLPTTHKDKLNADLLAFLKA